MRNATLRPDGLNSCSHGTLRSSKSYRSQTCLSQNQPQHHSKILAKSLRIWKRIYSSGVRLLTQLVAWLLANHTDLWNFVETCWTRDKHVDSSNGRGPASDVPNTWQRLSDVASNHQQRSLCYALREWPRLNCDSRAYLWDQQLPSGRNWEMAKSAEFTACLAICCIKMDLFCFEI